MPGDKMRTFGLIPLKSESTRFQGKNFSDLNGKPLIVNTLEKILTCLDTVFISTDDPERMSFILKTYNYKPKEYSEIYAKDNIESGIYIILRSSESCRPDSPTEVVVNELIDYLRFFVEDYSIVLCQVTSPNWESHVIKYALHKHEYYKYEKTIISVSPDYKPNGCFYIFNKSKFLKYHKIYSPDLYLVLLDWRQCTDIDYEYQLRIAEALDKGDYDEL